MTFSRHLLALVRFSIAANVALGLVVGVAFLIYGDTTANIDLTLEFGRFDGLWFVLLLPVFVTLALVPLSPVTFVIDRWLPGRQTKPEARGDE